MNHSVLASVGIFLLQALFAPTLTRANEPEGTEESYFGARFKEGKGVELAEEMRASLGLETAEVAEEPISSESYITVQVFSLSPETLATGLLSKHLSGSMNVGETLPLMEEGGSATLTRLSPPSRTGDLEGIFRITLRGRAASIGESIELRIPQASGEPVATIPASALLETVEGHFVYVVNGKHFLRTAVAIGRSGGDRIEITDGLYPGDVVVKSPVRPLWYAELQALRGGKACADGH